MAMPWFALVVLDKTLEMAMKVLAKSTMPVQHVP